MKTYWNKIKMVQNTAFVRDRYKRDVPLPTLKPFKIVQYCGTGTQFNIPGNISNYLSHLYGTGYKGTKKTCSIEWISWVAMLDKFSIFLINVCFFDDLLGDRRKIYC